ncbi:tetratricopeptide repeat (TPR)-like superfamily protein [Carex rostrata]
MLHQTAVSHLQCSPSPNSFSHSRSCFPCSCSTTPRTHSLLSLTRHTTLHATASSTSNPDETLLSLLESRQTDEAYTFFSRLPRLPNSVCLSRLLAQLSYNAKNKPEALSRAKTLFKRVVSAGELHRLDCNSLGLLACAAGRAGHAEFAASVVRWMLKSELLPHVKAWTAAVYALGSREASSDALKIFQMVMQRIRRERDADMAKSRLTMNSELSNSLPDTTAFNTALNACANIGDIKSFLQIFLNDMPEFKSKPDIVTYNVVVKMCARAGRRDLVVATLERAIDAGLNPDMSTFTSIVAAFIGFGDLTTSEKIIQAMREGRTDICQLLREQNVKNEEMDSSLLHDESIALLEKIVKSEGALEGPAPVLSKVYQPNARIYSTLMKGYMKVGRLDDVVWTLRAMKQEPNPASRPDHVTYTTVISALVNAGSMEEASEVLDEMKQARIPANRVTYNVLIRGYCKKLQLDKAKDLMREMEARIGVLPDVVTYNILIDGCLLIDNIAGALAYYTEMREKGIAPSKVSYTTLMKAFAFSGQPKVAHKVFDEMKNDPRVKVDRTAWNMLVYSYCKMGLISEAKSIIEQMKENGIMPDTITYGSLADCIAAARKPGEALLLWNEVKERCEGLPALKPDEQLLAPLADVCVRAGFFRKALEIVACMEENGIAPDKIKYRKIYIEMHSRMFTSPHASQARKDRRRERARAAEAFKFWLGLPNSYYDGADWTYEQPLVDNETNSAP